MAIEQPKIESVNNIFKYSLKIPEYQRPYVWGEKSVKKLFYDIYEAFNTKEKNKTYRLGTIILHNDKDENKLNIVDGQQRLITLSMLINNLDKTKEFMFDDKISQLSQKSICDNYNILEQMVYEITCDNNDFLSYILNNCEFVVIITDKQAEAFQFFDSQNTRGKTLEPHDILKAHHLREMKDMNQDEKIEIVSQWQNIEEGRLVELFAEYLYPIKLWSIGQNKKNFTKDEVSVYEGISARNDYNFIKYRIKNINEEINIFQINEEIFTGKYFFKYIFHYEQLLSMIEKMIENSNSLIILNNQYYINNIFKCALMLFADRFNFDILDKYINVMYKWSYGLRLSRARVDRLVINKYVKDEYRNNEIGCGPLFKIINELVKPEEIYKLNIKIDYNKHNKYGELREHKVFKQERV